MTPKGHCFFCDCLTERAVGKIAICVDCMDDLYCQIYQAHKGLKPNDPHSSRLRTCPVSFVSDTIFITLPDSAKGRKSEGKEE